MCEKGTASRRDTTKSQEKNANISRHIERTRLLLFKVTSFLNWSFRLSKGNRNFESCVIDMITLVTEYSIHLVVNSISSKDNRNIYRKYYSQNIFSLKSISLSTDKENYKNLFNELFFPHTFCI